MKTKLVWVLFVVGAVSWIMWGPGSIASANCGQCGSHKAEKQASAKGADTKEEACTSDSKKQQGCWCPLLSAAKLEVTKTEEGVTVKITSDDPEVRARLQEKWTECAKHQEAGASSACPLHKAHGEHKGEGKSEAEYSSCSHDKDTKEKEAKEHE